MSETTRAGRCPYLAGALNGELLLSGVYDHCQEELFPYIISFTPRHGPGGKSYFIRVEGEVRELN